MKTTFKPGDIVILMGHHYHGIVNTGVYIGPKFGRSNRHNIEVKYDGTGQTTVLGFNTEEFCLFDNVEDQTQRNTVQDRLDKVENMLMDLSAKMDKLLEIYFVCDEENA